MALIDKASLLMVPSTYEAGTLYNVLPSGNRAPDSTDQNSGYDQTRADFDFDRGSNASATRIGSDGLIEKYRENEALQSNLFNVSPWSLGNSVLTANATTSPTGESNAAKIESNGINKETRTRQTISGATTGKVYTFSCYMKAGNVSYGIVRHYGISSNGRAWFNLSTGTIGTKDSTLIDAQIESVGDGWYRCSITGKITTSGALDLAPAPNDNDYLSDAAGEYVFLYGAQAESSLVATDYLDSTSVTGKAGVLVDLPRINYDANGENGALLLEPSRQNLIPQSEYFGAWTLNGGGTGSNPVLDFGHTSPEGVDNAYKVTFDTGAGTTTSDESIMYISKSGLTAGNDYTASVYLKGAVGGEEVIVRDTEGSYTKWTLTTEWKRYEMTQAAAGSSYATSFGVRQGLGGIGTINSNAIVYMYAFQSEPGSYVSSYIPTMGTSETRAADFGSDDNITESPIEFGANDDFTLFYEGSFNDLSSTSNMIMGGGRQQLGASYKNYWWVQNATSMRITGDAEVRLATTSMSLSDNTNHKLLVKRSGSVVDFFVDGAKLTTTQNNPNTAFTFRSLGWAYTNSVYKVSGNIKKAMIFNEALTDAECISLTS